MNTEQRLQQLEREVQELKQWKMQRMRQQLTFPLDKISTDIIQKDLPVVQGKVLFTNSSGTIGAYILSTKINNKVEFIGVYPPPHIYTVDASSNVFTSINHGFQNDDQVQFYTTDSLPAGLSEGVAYYIISADTNTFKVSLTSGGSAVDITDAGTGTQYFLFSN